MLTLGLGLSVVPHGQYVFLLAALLAGLLADALVVALRPGPERPDALRAFAFAVPSALFGLYFLTLALSGGIAWTVHLWGEAIMLAGIAGLLLSYLVVPPHSIGARSS